MRYITIIGVGLSLLAGLAAGHPVDESTKGVKLFDAIQGSLDQVNIVYGDENLNKIDSVAIDGKDAEVLAEAPAKGTENRVTVSDDFNRHDPDAFREDSDLVIYQAMVPFPETAKGSNDLDGELAHGKISESHEEQRILQVRANVVSTTASLPGPGAQGTQLFPTRDPRLTATSTIPRVHTDSYTYSWVFPTRDPRQTISFISHKTAATTSHTTFKTAVRAARAAEGLSTTDCSSSSVVNAQGTLKFPTADPRPVISPTPTIKNELHVDDPAGIAAVSTDCTTTVPSAVFQGAISFKTKPPPKVTPTLFVNEEVEDAALSTDCTTTTHSSVFEGTISFKTKAPPKVTPTTVVYAVAEDAAVSTYCTTTGVATIFQGTISFKTKAPPKVTPTATTVVLE